VPGLVSAVYADACVDRKCVGVRGIYACVCEGVLMLCGATCICIYTRIHIYVCICIYMHIYFDICK